MRRALAVLLIGLIAPKVDGAALRVPSDYATINAALDAAASGDSVLVAPGTYSDYDVRVLHGGGPFTASSIAFLKGGVSLIGEGGREVTRIDLAGQGTGSAVPVLAYGLGPGTILLQGFTITGAPPGNSGMWSRFMDRMVIRGCRLEHLEGSAYDPGGLFSETVDLEVYDSEFLDCHGGSFASAAIGHFEGDVTLERCRFEACEGLAVGLSAISVSPPFDAVVRDCEFLNNAGRAASISNFVALTVEGCAFVGNQSPGIYTFAVYGSTTVPGPYVVRDNVFAQNGARAMDWEHVPGSIENNTFVGNERALTLDYDLGQVVTVQRNVFAHTSGIAVRFISSFVPPPTSDCNDFWENSGGDIVGYAPAPSDLFLAPQFCDEMGGDYSLSANSPCLPPNSGSCGQIGAFGQGCGGVVVEAETWAQTKSMYRSGADGRREP